MLNELLDSIKISIAVAIPRLTPEKVEQVANVLVDDHGVDDMVQLKLVEAEDLKSVLKTVQIRTLLQSWRGTGKLFNIKV